MTNPDDTSELRGLARLLARETNVSDLLQHLTDLDPTPWTRVPGVERVPAGSTRERALAKVGRGNTTKGTADLELRDEVESIALVELKLSHVFSNDQRERYERSSDTAALLLTGLASDRELVAGSDRWTFVSLATLFGLWEKSHQADAASLATAATAVLRSWDTMLADLMEQPGTGSRRTVDAIPKKFLARLVARRMAERLDSHWSTWAGTSSGGGLAIAQAWATIDAARGHYLIAEIRWHEGLQSGELRFGVDFEAAAARAEAWQLATLMTDVIRVDELQQLLVVSSPRLSALLVTEGSGRPRASGDWEGVIARGLNRTGAGGAVKGTRRSHTPDFYGDGTRRYEAKSTIDFAMASAADLVDLIDVTLRYLVDRVPPNSIERAEEATTA